MARKPTQNKGIRVNFALTPEEAEIIKARVEQEPLARTPGELVAGLTRCYIQAPLISQVSGEDTDVYVFLRSLGKRSDAEIRLLLSALLKEYESRLAGGKDPLSLQEMVARNLDRFRPYLLDRADAIAKGETPTPGEAIVICHELKIPECQRDRLISELHQQSRASELAVPLEKETNGC